MITDTPILPYYAVIFTSIRSDVDDGYSKTSDRMIELAEQQEGFLGVESARKDYGITISYWKDLESISRWKNNVEHKVARERGKKEWYLQFNVRIGKIEKEYQFIKH